MSRFVDTLDPADLDELEVFAVALMAALFKLVESSGYCFDVLVREAIERGERQHPHCSECGRPWEDHYEPASLKFKLGPFGTFGLKPGDHTPHLDGVHAPRRNA